MSTRITVFDAIKTREIFRLFLSRLYLQIHQDNTILMDNAYHISPQSWRISTS